MFLKKEAQPTPATTPSIDQEREHFHRQILSSVSHDLKTPLASIIGSLEVYERMSGRLSNEQKKSLITVALQEAYRLDNFITNILDMAKLENGMVALRAETVAVRSMIEDCITRFSHRLKAGQVKVAPADQPLEIATDPALFSRALLLVLDNAIRYGGDPLLIEIAYGQENGLGFIHIMDNGAGIPEERMGEAILSKYTRFARGDQQNAGTGLGLAICREIMRLLKGTVAAANNPQASGATFTLRFPL